MTGKGAPASSSYDRLFGAGNALIPGWSVDGYVFRAKSNQAQFQWVKAVQGTHFLVLQGSSASAPPGSPKPATISTTVPALVVGQQYRLSWSERGRPSYGDMTLTVTAGETADASSWPYLPLTLSPSHSVARGWASMSAIFTASSPLMVIRFVAPWRATSNGSVLLDAISVVPLADWRPSPAGLT